MKNKVWIVTYWDDNEEPVVTPFDNPESAQRCCNYFKKEHDGCCVDECEVYGSFIVARNENE